MAHTREWKERNLNALKARIKDASVVGVVSIKGLPAYQFQQIRKKLAGKAEIHVSRAKLLKMAIDEAAKERKGLDQLSETLKNDQAALIYSTENPFALFRFLESSKTPLAARGGEIAPEDIEIRAGETQFKPGPVVGELQKAGIPASIEGGKVVIKKDKLLVRKGDIIQPQIAAALTKMEIYPLVAGLDVKALYEDGLIFRREVLQVDDARMLEDVIAASRQALSVAVAAKYFTSQSVRFLLCDAYRKAINLGVNAEIATQATVGYLLAKAAAEASTLSKKTEGASEENK